MRMHNLLIKLLLLLILSACTSSKHYENDIMPTGDWYPVNPEYFNKDEAQRIREGYVSF